MDADSERAFEQFVQQRSAALFRTAYLLCGDAHQAEDLPALAAWQPDDRLPRRTPIAHLDARLQEPPGAPARRPAASRSPDDTRSMLTSYQDGLRQARSYLQGAHADTAGP
jgi:hypothetical protein